MKRITINFLAAILLAVSVFALNLPADDKSIEKIEFKGRYTVPNEEIAKQVKTKVGDKFIPDALTADFERILAMKLFDDTKCAVVSKQGPGGGVIVTFILVDKPRK